MVAFDADLAEAWAKRGQKPVIMVRPETKPDDVHGMLAAKGILTSRGGRTSHAALVARQFGKPAVVGVSELKIDMAKRQMTRSATRPSRKATGSPSTAPSAKSMRPAETMVPDIKDPWLIKLLSWADEYRRLGVWANADYPDDARRARNTAPRASACAVPSTCFSNRPAALSIQKMIMTDLPIERREALDALLPFQREDFAGLFRAMDGLPVIIRLIDPPLHEFLPDHMELMRELSDLKIRLQHAAGPGRNRRRCWTDPAKRSDILKRVESLREANPMLGLRGVRLGIHIPELTTMQVGPSSRRPAWWPRRASTSTRKS
jgi:pyruvate,orthophosphate dikinase